MKQSKGIISGIVFDMVLCMPCLIWWALIQKQVAIRPVSFRSYISLIMVLIFVSIAVTFSIWFKKAYKEWHFGEQKRLKYTNYWVFGGIVALALAFIPVLICQFGLNYNLAESFLYLSISFGVAFLGSIIPYMIFKP